MRVVIISNLFRFQNGRANEMPPGYMEAPWM
jgi:hypothetical protein